MSKSCLHCSIYFTVIAMTIATQSFFPFICFCFYKVPLQLCLFQKRSGATCTVQLYTTLKFARKHSSTENTFIQTVDPAFIQTLPKVPLRSYKSATHSLLVFTSVLNVLRQQSLHFGFRSNDDAAQHQNVCVCVCVSCGSTPMIHLYVAAEREMCGEKISLHNYALCSRPMMNSNMAADCIVIN